MTDIALLPRSAPETQGIQSSAVLAFLDAVEREIHDLHSFILLRRGTVVAEGYWEPYGPAYPHMLFSLSKSFTSTAIGMLVAERRLSVDDQVLGFFPDEAPAEPSANLRSMRVRDLLSMTTGHDSDATGALRQPGSTWTRAFLIQPVEHMPGTHFVYNSAATYMLSAIVQRITGERLIDYLGPRLFAPLGIEHPTWETSPEGIDVGGWGLSITTADIARFGQLYLQGGVWQGERLFPKEWVADATSYQVPNGPSEKPDWEQGYGYQFWRCRHGAYRGDGAFGQFCIVMPDQEAVLAITAGVGNMQSVLDLVWEHLLPAMSQVSVSDNSAGQTALADRLATLHLAPSAGQPRSPLAAEVSSLVFVLDDNPGRIEAFGFDFGVDGCWLNIRDEHGAQRILCGYGRWLRGEGRFLHPGVVSPELAATDKVAASGAWLNDQTFVVDLCGYQSPFRLKLTCHFEGDQLWVDRQLNVWFGSTELPRLTGRATRPIGDAGTR